MISIREIISINIAIICYGSKDVAPSSLRSISRHVFSSLTPLHVPVEEHDNTMDANNRR